MSATCVWPLFDLLHLEVTLIVTLGQGPKIPISSKINFPDHFLQRHYEEVIGKFGLKLDALYSVNFRKVKDFDSLPLKAVIRAVSPKYLTGVQVRFLL